MDILKTILTIMKTNNLDAMLITNTNEHLSEFIGESDMRIKEMTGFSGSNAKLVITNKESALFTDDRYFLQAKEELVHPFNLIKGDGFNLIVSFLKEKADGGRVGIEQKFISHTDFTCLEGKLSEVNISLIPVESSTFQDVWAQLPTRGVGNIIDLEEYDASQYLTFKRNSRLQEIYQKLFTDKYTYDYKDMLEDKLLPGLRYNNKIKIVQKSLNINEGLILTTLDSVAWLLNLRGTVMPENTVFYGYVYITKNNVTVFTDHKIPRNLTTEPYDSVYEFLTSVQEKKIFIQSKVNYQIAQSIGIKKISKNNSFDKLKSVKNDNEIAGFFQAAILDGLSLIKLFFWLSKTRFPLTETDVSRKLISIKKHLKPRHTNSMQKQDTNIFKQKNSIFNGALASHDVNQNELYHRKEETPQVFQNHDPTPNPNDIDHENLKTGKETHKMVVDDLEIDISTDFKESPRCDSASSNELLENPRESKTKTPNNDIHNMPTEVMNIRTGFLFPSFANIVAYAQNGAIVHHSANDTQINREGLLLIDSGSQYLFGTTDITRTVSLNDATKEQKHNFTLVLKGQILAKRFRGSEDNDELALMIENLPKYYLLQENKDYQHSTSHGIGTGLFVHESPPFANYHQIVPHQVFSIEPGFYKEGHYGIRIEDAVISLKKENIHIQNMTFLPYQRSLIEKSLLTNEELEYLNEYHETVQQIFSEFLNHDEMQWLKSETEAL